MFNSIDENKKIQMRNKAYTFIFYFTLTIYLLSVIKICLFKYVPINELFSENRTFARSLNLIPYSDWNVDRLSLRRDVILNTYMYLPFGFLLQYKSKSLKQSLLFSLIPLLFSFVMETLQYVFYFGSADATDLISNFIGALLGMLFYLFLNKIFCKKHDKFIKIISIIMFIVAIIQLCLIL